MSPRIVVTSILILVATTLASTDLDGAPADLAPLRKALVDALKAKDAAAVEQAALKLTEEGSATAGEILIVDGLLCDDPPLEAVVRDVLREIEPSPILDWLCTRCNQHEQVAVRIQLVDVLSLRKEKNAFKSVLTALFDPKDPVIVAAIDALGKKNHRGAIPHLIKALEHQEKQQRELGQLADDIRNLLNKWTGEDLFGSGEFQTLWKRHQDALLDPANKRKKDPLGEVEPVAGGTGVYRRVPTFFGQEILSQRVVFILDTSISMKAVDPPPKEKEPDEPGEEGDGGRTGVGKGGKGGRKGGAKKHSGSRERLKRVQNELVRMISDLPKGFKFDVVSFDQEVVLFSKGLRPASAENKRRAIKFVRKFEADGQTWTDEALEKAFEVSGARTMVLLSDGMPYRKPNPINVLELLDWVDERNRFAKVRIHTVGFQSTSGEVGGFLRELSRRNGGKYTEIP